jgi:predicted secreted protein
MRKAIALCAGALLLASCAAGETVLVTESESLQEVLLDSGDVLEVQLVSNATTGYEWVIAWDSLPDYLVLTDEEFVEPESTLVGAPGHQIFTFDVTEKGAGILRLEYVRLFEDPVIPASIVEYIVRVDDAPWPPEGVTPPGTSSSSTP